MKKLILFLLLVICSYANAENIDPYVDGSKFAYAENVGWINFDPGQGTGVQVSSSSVEGFVWSENIGWINLSPTNYGGVFNDGNGNFSGFAWGENVGWINFNPTVPDDGNDYGVKIASDGRLSGYAWGENIGWVNFGIVESYVVICKVGIEDLHNFMNQWLETGAGLDADIDNTNKVDMQDYAAFAGYWMTFCPDAWQLK
ncbi:MAG: hypothetical protein K9M75_03880 [Phycisphaerae bacterium]|nr:hypothetical protein [Phycisphaerae bacterium]